MDMSETQKIARRVGSVARRQEAPSQHVMSFSVNIEEAGWW